jgi:hypothetical protein
MLKPMPSPAGTNYEKLYILRGRGASTNPSGAYDSAYNPHAMTTAQAARYGAALAKKLVGRPQLAYDEGAPDPLAGAGEGASNADAVGTIVKWVRENLDERGKDELLAALGRDRADMGLDRRRPAMDAHRQQRGMSSAAHASFHELFPDAARIRTW